MGVSIPLAAIIIFIGAVAFIASASNLMINVMQSLVDLALGIDVYYRVYTRIEISNVAILNGTITLLVKNFGPETVFLVDQGYKWCSLTISYNSTLGWVTYLLDNYDVTGITIINSNATNNNSRQEFISPGEGAWITVNLPDGAPEIIEKSPIIIVFSSRFGETAKCVVVKDD